MTIWQYLREARVQEKCVFIFRVCNIIKILCSKWKVITGEAEDRGTLMTNGQRESLINPEQIQSDSPMMQNKQTHKQKLLKLERRRMDVK